MLLECDVKYVTHQLPQINIQMNFTTTYSRQLSHQTASNSGNNIKTPNSYTCVIISYQPCQLALGEISISLESPAVTDGIVE